jgi:hypothetical protein
VVPVLGVVSSGEVVPLSGVVPSSGVVPVGAGPSGIALVDEAPVDGLPPGMVVAEPADGSSSPASMIDRSLPHAASSINDIDIEIAMPPTGAHLRTIRRLIP